MKKISMFERAFAPRQIIVSTDGQPKYLHIGTKAQIAALTGCVSAIAIIVGLTLHTSAQNDAIGYQNKQLTLLQEKVRDVSSHLLYSRANLTLTKSELDQQYARLENILNERRNLETTLQTATANLEQKNHDITNRDQYARDLENRINMLSTRLSHTNTRSEELSLKITKINKALYQTTEERDLHAEGKLIAQKRLSSLNRELQIFQSTKDEIYNELQSTRTRLSTFEKDRIEKEKAVDDLIGQVKNLKGRISTISRENKGLITRVQQQAEQGIDALSETITLTGLNPDVVLSMDNVEGKGGPFYGSSNSQDLLEIEQRYYKDAQKMEASLVKWTTLNALLKNIPLAKPVDSGYITSSFGKRRDPVTKKRGFHSGVDISGPKNSSILATAPGKVIFVGRNGAYGLMVEIDHGQGFKSKYGHLKKTHVKKGQEVDFRTKIGTMGSTGRSTGRHVHYEVIYNGENQSPEKFFKAGNYAFKTSSVSD
ncbi:MAG: peptidoglycan DD-metalloendopeptidase family protein [Sneathiella sp.]